MDSSAEPNWAIVAERRFVEARRSSGDALVCPLTADEALDALRRGNATFRSSDPCSFEIGALEPEGSAAKQCPIAVVVCCSDSRVPPELVFWQGLGRLFVTRVAGNTVDAGALGSIVYALQNFRTPLVVVLGHEGCGAIAAAVDFVERGTIYDRSLNGVVEPLLPAVLAARRACGSGGDLAEAATRQNVRRTVAALRAQTAGIHGGGIPAPRIVGGRYDLNHGDVDFFDLAPEPAA